MFCLYGLMIQNLHANIAFFLEKKEIKNKNYFYAASIFCDFWKATYKLYVRAMQGLGLDEKSITSCPH